MIETLHETLRAVRAHRGTMRDAALMYAAAGLEVFPCVPGGKQPLTTRGYRDATTGARRIRGWWAWQPEANIGIATGHGLNRIDAASTSNVGWCTLAVLALGCFDNTHVGAGPRALLQGPTTLKVEEPLNDGLVGPASARQGRDSEKGAALVLALGRVCGRSRRGWRGPSGRFTGSSRDIAPKRTSETHWSWAATPG